jgi:hypothetical protein
MYRLKDVTETLSSGACGSTGMTLKASDAAPALESLGTRPGPGGGSICSDKNQPSLRTTVASSDARSSRLGHRREPSTRRRPCNDRDAGSHVHRLRQKAQVASERRLPGRKTKCHPQCFRNQWIGRRVARGAAFVHARENHEICGIVNRFKPSEQFNCMVIGARRGI